MGNKWNLRPKEVLFWEEYTKRGNHADAYMAAGYKVKSREVARTAGSRLLRRLDENMDYREVLDSVGLTNRHLAQVLKKAVNSDDERIQVGAVGIATKVKGWQRDDPGVQQGAQMIIVQNLSKEDLEADDPVADDGLAKTRTMKPIQITR